MHLPKKVYTWLVDLQLIDNKGQIDHQDDVTLTKIQTSNFINGYLMGELLKKYATNNHLATPLTLADIKTDHSKNTKLTNWNFIWLALSEIGLKFDSRIKELILQGEDSLIGEVIRQLYDHDESKGDPSVLKIKQKISVKAKQSQQIDMKKIDFNKDPQSSINSLQFLVLLLKESLGMNLQQILGLFTNQNKYLALIIVKGINQNFEPIILFYTLLNKHFQKLLQFYHQNEKDGEAFMHALKPGFMSQCQRVAELTLELFGRFQSIFQWFVGAEHKCINTFMLGFKRHQSIGLSYWQLLLKIINDRQLQFFTKHYELSFTDATQLIDITKLIIPYLTKSFLKDELTNIGVIDSWIDIAVKLQRKNLQAQVVAFGFIGQLMMEMPSNIEEHEEGMNILIRDWKERCFIHFTRLVNELIQILEVLGENKSQMAKKVFVIVAEIVKNVGCGDKRDYLVEQFTPLISKFPTIPSQHFISNLNTSFLSHSELLLICQSIQTNTHLSTEIQICSYLKKIFIQNPLVNFYVAPLIAELVEKIMHKLKGQDLSYCFGLIEEVLYGYAVSYVKYRPKFKVNNQLYFGRRGNPQGVSREDEMDLRVSSKYKELYLTLASKLMTLLFSLNDNDIKQVLKQKALKIDSYIKFHNSKVPSKELRDFLFYRFKIMIEDKSDTRSKVTPSQVDPIEKYTKITSEERKYMEERQYAVMEKKYLDFKRKKVSKELEKSNIKVGQVTIAQVSDDGVFESFVQQPKELPLLPLDELEQRDVKDIDLTLKKNNKVLRHLFHLYTGTKYSTRASELIEDIEKRKQTLTSVQLIQMLKDYKKLYLTSPHQVNTMIRDINIKLLSKRNVTQLDFRGFQMFIIQFCHYNMRIPHEITTNTTVSKAGHQINSEEKKVSKKLENQNIGIVMREFFKELKGTFVSRNQKIEMFEDFQDIIIPKQQEEEVKIFESKLERNPHYILPAGYKKVAETRIDFKHKLSANIKGLSQSFEIAFDALDFIFQKSVGIHVMEDLAEEKNHYKVKCAVFNSPDKIAKQRAMSTMAKGHHSPLGKKNVVFPKEVLKILKNMSPQDKAIGQEVMVLIEQMIDKIDIPDVKTHLDPKPEKTKEEATPKRRARSTFKVEKAQPMKIRSFVKRLEEKQEAKKREKEQQKKRREHIQKFLQEQKLKILEKKKKEEDEKNKRKQEEAEKLAQKKANVQKFKSFHQGQVEKIKKIQQEALENKRRAQQDETRQKEKEAETYRHLKSQIQEHEKIRSQTHREIEKQLIDLFNNESTKSTFKAYEVNLRAVFDFLLDQTHHSLTERNHNNEIVYETWKYFLHSFQLMPLILQSKQGVLIFKVLTRSKEVSKQTLVGLNYKDFLEALLRIAVKYKGFFNLIGERITSKQPLQSEALNSSDLPEPQYNEFNADDVTIDKLLKQNNEGKNELNQYGDISKVTDKTLKGLIHYLKVPKSKAGQMTRFRQILEFKPPILIHKSERLKEKLSEEYSLIQSPKKNNKSGLLQLKSKVDQLINDNEIK